MKHSQHCLLGVTRIRRVFLCLGFSFLVLWILLGNYNVDQGPRANWKKTKATEISNGTLRKLMQADDGQEKFDPNGTNEDVECSSIHNYGKSELCEFVKKVPTCGGDEGFIPYFEFVYCAMPYNLLPLSMILLALWLLYLFMFLGTTAESFFCRELTFITQLLRLSQNVAGVTLLAIGNGAPDIFSALAAFNHPDPKKSSLAFGALFGAGMFVTNIVAGLVCIFHPFQVTRRPFLRDNIFYLFAVYWVFFLLWDNKITLVIAIGLLLYYVSYVLVVVLGSIIYQKWLIWQSRRQEKSKEAILFKKNERKEEDSLGQSQTGEVILDEETKGQPPHKLCHTKSGGRETLPVVVVTKEDNDSDSSRPKTPTERSALRATQIVYYSSDQGERARRRRQYSPNNYLSDNHGETPRPRSRLEKVFDNAVYMAEDMIASSNPNLAKLWKNEYEKEMRREREGSRRTTPYFSTTAVTPKIDEETSFQKRNVSSSSSEDEDEDEEKKKIMQVDEEEEQELNEDAPLLRPNFERVHPGRKLLKALFPFTEDKFKFASLFGKIFMIIRYPLTLILTLTIPVIDVDEPMNNWNKWLTVIQCMTAPIFVFLAIEPEKFGLIMIGGYFPVMIIIFVVSIGLAVLVALTSSNNKPPFYHCVFAWAGFALSVLWIYTIANEIVNLLQVFGVVVKLSDGILGITLLAWGNSIQDSVTNVTMARQGFPKMAVGACFGGPLLNILIGIGLASVIRSLREPGNEFKIYLTQVTMLAGLFLILSLVISLVVISCLQFRMRRLYGIFLFLFYLAFTIVVILAEVGVFSIHIDVLSTSD